MGFVPYQVDYSTQNTAKTLGFTKKKVSFKFGFANPQALRSGATGAACRGSEHELVFLWSLKSGKRQLFLDGRDVHFSESGQNGWTADRAWQHAFTMRDATGTYRVHFISQPKNPDLPDSKPFDLRVAGVSYFAFNRIFQLGTPTMTVRENNRDTQHRSGGRDSPMSPEERRLVAAAKVESLRDLQRQQEQRSSPQRSKSSPEQPPPAALPRDEPNLLSFDDDPVPPPPPPTAVASSGYRQFASSVTMDSSFAMPSPPQQAPNPYGQQPQSTATVYGQQWQQPGPYGSGYESGPPQQQQSSGYGQEFFGMSSAAAPPPLGQAPAPPPPAQQLQQQTSSYSNFGSSFSNIPPAPAAFGDATATSSSQALTPYQAPTVSTGPAPSPYAMPLPLSTPTSSYTAGYQQQTQPPPSFASPSAQSYVSYGSAPSFAHPPSQNNQSQQQPPPPSFTASSSFGGGDAGGGYSVPQPLSMHPQASSASFYQPPPPQVAQASAPNTTPFGDPNPGFSNSYGAPPPMPPQAAPYGYPQPQYPGY